MGKRVGSSKSTAGDEVQRGSARPRVFGRDRVSDGGNLALTAVSDATNGTVSLNGKTGEVVFSPADNYTGPASFTYTISNGKGVSATATANVTVQRVADAAVAYNDAAYITSLNTLLTIPAGALLANHRDGDGKPGGVIGSAKAQSVVPRKDETAVVLAKSRPCLAVRRP